MEANVIDTNVLITANGDAEHASLKCTLQCLKLLESIKNSGEIVLLDAKGEIWEEYKKYCNFSGKPNVGDYFFKWLHNQSGNDKIVRTLELKKSDNTACEYQILVGIDCLNGFDRSDQKFLALAMTFNGTATIHNATDSDWYNYEDCIRNIEGVRLNQLCPSAFRTNTPN